MKDRKSTRDGKYFEIINLKTILKVFTLLSVFLTSISTICKIILFSFIHF